MNDYELMQLPIKIDAMIQHNKKILDEAIDEYEIRIGTKKEKPNDRYYLKLSKNKFRLVKQLDKEFANLRFIELTPYELPSEIETKINQLKPMLTDNQAAKLKKIVNNCLKQNNKAQKEKVETTAKKVRKLIKQLRWDIKFVPINISSMVFLDTAIDIIKDEKLKKLQYKLFVYPVEEFRTPISYERDGLIEPEKYNNQANLIKLRDNLCHFIQFLKEESEADFTSLIKFLEKMENKAIKELKAGENYLDKSNRALKQETDIQVKDDTYHYDIKSIRKTETPEFKRNKAFDYEDLNESTTSSEKYEKMMQRTRRN